MAVRTVGLDIGTFAVRAAELSIGGERPTLLRFGQVTLPPGAMQDGEIANADAVGAAIRRLWSEAGFRSKRVVVGVANQRVIVRQADLPAMTDEDMRSALQFEAQELIPIPLDEAILDFQVLEEMAGAEGEPLMRLLLAAAQRDMVRTHLAALERGGLAASTVDLVPFALIRALTLGQRDFETPDQAEAIVNIGAGVTNVVVHEGGIPRFVRILLVGGDDVSEAIASELNVDIDLAEDLKRRADEGSGDDLVARAGSIVARRLGPLVEEIRGSLDFYLAQSDAVPFSRILITGGGARTPGLMDRLNQTLSAQVELAHVLQQLEIGKVGLTDTQLSEAEPLLAVPVGLALAAGPVEAGARRITLLPAEELVVREQRRQLVLTGTAVAGLFVVLMLLWAARGVQVNRERDEAEQREAEVAQLQQEVNQFQDLTTLETDLRQRLTAARGVLEGDVEWTRLLQEVATAMPNDVWLTAFAGTNAEPGNVNFSAMGFDQTSTARWLLRIGELPGFTGLWVPSSTKAPGPRGLVTFTSTANLTEAARSDRAAQLGQEPPA
jgi:type IV pilus assembly protein PilM